MLVKPLFSVILLFALASSDSSNQLLAKVTSYSDRLVQPFNTNSQVNFDRKPIQVINGKVVLTNNLQNELDGEIGRAKVELQELANNFSLQFTEDVGIVYFHKGQDDWSIKFTFGGLVLSTSEEIIFTTDQVFALKNCFEKAKAIEIKGKTYQTTGRMRQLGPILHEEDEKK